NAGANNGKMIKPILVKAIRPADDTKKAFETEVLNGKICCDKTLAKLRLMLEGVVETETAKDISDSHYRIAGKTGTAQILENGRYTRKYITSFVGYFPAHDPKYSAIVLIRNPRGWQQYGSSVAAPVFKEIADNIYARDISLHLPMDGPKYTQTDVFPVIRAGRQQDLVMLCNMLGVSNHPETESEWVRTVRNGNSVDLRKQDIRRGIVPDVSGMTLRDALYVLEQVGLQVSFEGIGRVERQSLPPGRKIRNGDRVYLRLG